MKQTLLNILACPACQRNLLYNKVSQELICRVDRLAYPIEKDIPIMMVDKARRLSVEEYENLK